MSEFRDKIKEIDKLLIDKLTEDEKTALMDIEGAVNMGDLCTTSVFKLDFVKFERHIKNLLSDKVKKQIDKGYEDFISGYGYENESKLTGILSASDGNNDYFEREQLRNLKYGGSIDSKPPNGFSSWGDYWKGY